MVIYLTICVDLSKNRLYSLPAGLEKLTSLKTLNLESNYIESLNEGIGKMDCLQTLLLSKNRLLDVPEPLCNLSNLKILNVEKNKLYFLPDRMKKMNLVELRVGHNRIEILADDLFSENLRVSLKTFSCCENNMMELPTSLWRIDPEASLDAEYNPLISPPTYLLAEGLKVVQNYLRIRISRVMQFNECLLDEDFEFDPQSVTPIATEVLLDGTGYLTPDDLAEFDQAVDEFINGEYFMCPASAQEMVASLSKLRDDRETELYLLIIDKLLGVLKLLTSGKSKDKRYNDSAIFTSTRPWGRRGESANVFVICLDALLNDNGPNPYLQKMRPSIYNLVAAAMPRIAFPFSIDMMKDAVRLYASPYNQVAEMEEAVEFPRCQCVDAVRGKKLRHKKCLKPALVLCKSIYVDEEANRREVEEDEFLLKFQDIEDEVRLWLLTEEGIRLCDLEVKRRKEVLREEIRLREEMLSSQQMKKKRAQEAMRMVEKRKLQFEYDEGFDVHGFNDIGEAIKALSEATDAYSKLQARVEVLEGQVVALRLQLSVDFKVCMAQAGDDAVQKYCVLAYHSVVDQFRKHALNHNLKRHWDGEDGDAFEKFKLIHVAHAADPTAGKSVNQTARLLYVVFLFSCILVGVRVLM
jgi:hypothetical protein